MTHKERGLSVRLTNLLFHKNISLKLRLYDQNLAGGNRFKTPFLSVYKKHANVLLATVG